MYWESYRQSLEAGETVKFRPKGKSMEPKINSGELVTVEPIKDYSKIKKGDIVFCKVNGIYYVHLVQSVQQKTDDFRFQIGNNKNHTNGIIGKNQLFGKVTKVEK